MLPTRILAASLSILVIGCPAPEPSQEVIPQPEKVEAKTDGQKDKDYGVAYKQETIRLEKALVAYADQRDDKQLAALLVDAEAAAKQNLNYTYLWYLYAYTSRLAGLAEQERTILDQRGRDVEGWYQYFFGKPFDELITYLRYHQMHMCLRDSGGKVPSFFWNDNQGRLGGPVSCGGQTVEPAGCPRDYSLFERITLRSRGTDRLSLWHPEGTPVSMDEFATMIGLEEGMVVADVGAGMGYFTLPLARQVGAGGVVYAVEIDPHALTLLDYLARFHELGNIKGVVTVPDRIGIDAGTLDLVFMCDTLKNIIRGDPPAANLSGELLQSIYSATKPGGLFVVPEKVDTESEPRPVTMDRISGTVTAVGFVHEKTLPAFLPGRHILIFRKPVN